MGGGEEVQQWYYNFRNTLRGDSTRSTKSPATSGVRADAPKIFFDRSTQWERRAEWTVDAGTQTDEKPKMERDALERRP